MLRRSLLFRTAFLCFFVSSALLLLFMPQPLHAQDDDSKFERHGRKYKAPPETSEIEVTVLKGFNKKPVVNAAVVFHPVDQDGKDEGFLEMKTDPDGKAKIDVIPTGSTVRIQVIATGFATFAQDYHLEEPQKKVTISLLRPRAQVSTFVDESGKPSMMKPGVQEPIRPKPVGTANSPEKNSSSAGSEATSK